MRELFVLRTSVGTSFPVDISPSRRRSTTAVTNKNMDLDTTIYKRRGVFVCSAVSGELECITFRSNVHCGSSEMFASTCCCARQLAPCFLMTIELFKQSDMINTPTTDVVRKTISAVYFKKEFSTDCPHDFRLS